MSDVGISYEGQPQPSTIGVSMALSFSGTTLKGTVSRIDPFILVLRPSGNVAEAILSSVAYPIAQTLGATLPSLVTSFVGGFSFDVVTLGSTTEPVLGEQVTVTPSNLRAGNFNGYLMVSGSIDLS